MSTSAGQIWLADRGTETRRLVDVVSDTRFHRLAERAVVAPVLDGIAAAAQPWHVRRSRDRAIAVNLLATLPIERLLDRAEWLDAEILRLVRRAVRAVTT